MELDDVLLTLRVLFLDPILFSSEMCTLKVSWYWTQEASVFVMKPIETSFCYPTAQLHRLVLQSWFPNIYDALILKGLETEQTVCQTCVEVIRQSCVYKIFETVLIILGLSKLYHRKTRVSRMNQFNSCQLLGTRVGSKLFSWQRQEFRELRLDYQAAVISFIKKLGPLYETGQGGSL